MLSIENQIAVVTGAGRGIGQAIAIELGKLGARATLVARSRAELEKTAAVIGKSASVNPADVRRKKSFKESLSTCRPQSGPWTFL
jgi:7-alpha-hydroxysteroid dehydrogenase